MTVQAPDGTQIQVLRDERERWYGKWWDDKWWDGRLWDRYYEIVDDI